MPEIKKFYTPIQERHLHRPCQTLNDAYAEAVDLAKKENQPVVILKTIARVVPKVVIADVEDVRPDQPAQQEDTSEKRAAKCVSDIVQKLKANGFQHDPFTNTWKKTF